MKKILIIGESEKDQIAYKDFLEKHRYNVSTVSKYGDGLKITQKELPDIIIVAEDSNDIECYAICNKIKKSKAVQNIPTIIISDNKNRLKYLQVGTESFLSKPINNDELLAQVKSLIQIKETANNFKKGNSENKKIENIAHSLNENLIPEIEIKFLEKFPYPLAITKGNNNIYLNRNFTSEFGYTLHDIPTAKEWFEKAYPDHEYRELVKTTWNDAVETAIRNNSEIRTQEWNLITKNGVKKTCEYSMVPLGETSLIVMRDITKRKRAELIQIILYQISNAAYTSKDLPEFLELIRQHLGSVIDTTNFFVAFYNEDQNLLYSPYEVDEKDKIFSWTASKSLTGYVIKHKKPLFIKKDEILKMHEAGEIELIGTTAEVWIGVPLMLDNQVMGAVVVQSYTNAEAYDIKDLKLLEFISHQISISIQRIIHEIELENALNKAIESDRLKSVFLSTMSHELRTPLNAIIGFSELIGLETKPDDVQKFAKTIFNSGTLLLELVEGLFDITLIEAGEIKVEKNRHNLKEIIDDVVDVIQAERIKTNKELIKLNICDYPFSHDFKIFTDNQKLKQILINLLKNAFKFTHHGSVTLDISETQVKEELFIKFTISDTGIGIPKDKFSLIFDVFRQADDTHTRKYGGAGIGLSVTQKLTVLLGGKIDVESEVNKGTSFHVFIPVSGKGQNLNSGAKKEDVFEIVYPQKTILVVEDDDSSMTLLKVYLKKLGVNILHAVNGIEAIEIFRSGKKEINLVLMDINMPVMNGYDATREIRKINSSVPVIAQTAYAITGDREKALKSGFDDYISKPINGNQLVKLIKKFL